MTSFFSDLAFVVMTSLFAGIFASLLVVLLVIFFWISRLSRR